MERQEEDLFTKMEHLLGERVKELTCLYNISILFGQHQLSLDECIQGVVEAIPPAMQFPEIACARITLQGRRYTAGNFSKTPWRLASEISEKGEKTGELEVCYLIERPADNQGPFLPEETSLINTIALQLGVFLKQKRGEEIFQQQQTYMRLIIETARDAFISINASGIIHDWNRAAETTFGWSRQEAIGQPLTEMIVPKQLRQAHIDGLKRYLATGEERVLNKTIEIMALHRNGIEFPIELSIVPLHTADTISFNAFMRDITERKQAEKALEQKVDELERYLKATVSRELKMKDLRKEIRSLQLKLNQFQTTGELNQQAPNNPKEG